MSGTKRPKWKGIIAGPPITTFGKSGSISLPSTATIAIEDYERPAGGAGRRRATGGPPLLVDLAWSQPVWAMVRIGLRTIPDEWGYPQELPPRTQDVAGRQFISDVLRTVGRQTPTVRDSYPDATHEEIWARTDEWIAIGKGQAMHQWSNEEMAAAARDVDPHTAWESKAAAAGLSTWDLYQQVVEEYRPISQWTAQALARGRDQSQQSVEMMSYRAETLARQLILQGVTGRKLYQRVADELDVGRTTAFRYLQRAGVTKKAGRR